MLEVVAVTVMVFSGLTKPITFCVPNGLGGIDIQRSTGSYPGSNKEGGSVILLEVEEFGHMVNCAERNLTKPSKIDAVFVCFPSLPQMVESSNLKEISLTRGTDLVTNGVVGFLSYHMDQPMIPANNFTKALPLEQSMGNVGDKTLNCLKPVGQVDCFLVQSEGYVEKHSPTRTLSPSVKEVATVLFRCKL